MRIFCIRGRFVALLMATFLALSGVWGCGGSGTDDTTVTGQQSDVGELAVSLTDAPGDFTAYTVDVLSLTLTKANGAQVSTLPLETRIDFSQYTDMTEFLTAATVPSGVYVAATLTLGYDNADIWVEDELGANIKVEPENIVDENGAQVTTLEMTVRLEGRNRLPIAPGLPAHLLLDFDLNATHQVNLDDPLAPVVTVDPFLVADVNRTSSKLHRVRGALNEVTVDQNSFSLFLRPFYSPLSGRHRQFGARTVTTTSKTVFEIDGIQYTGETGLDAMAALDPLTAVVAIGDLKFDPLRFEAREVYAGSSVPGGTMDVVRGSVIIRQGDVLTVKGATLIREKSSVVFNDEVKVKLGAETVVSRQLSTDQAIAYGIDSISVGQRVVVFGTLTEEGESLVLDAGAGHVRMLLTTVRGTATEIDVSEGQLTAALQAIDHRLVDSFDFTGTNADPDNYLIDTGTLDLSAVQTGSPVKVRGFVNPFGAPSPDFTAQTIISVEDLQALLKVHWHPPTNVAFESVSADGLTLNLENAGRFHHVFRGWVGTDLTQLGLPVSVIPQADGRGCFALHYADGSIQVYLEFENFAEALTADLADNLLVRKLHATGEFDDAGAILTADVVEVKYAAEGQNPN